MNRASCRRRILKLLAPAMTLSSWPMLAMIALLALAPVCKAAVRVEAFGGEPYGVGRVTLDLSRAAAAEPSSDDRFTVADDEGRVLYPVLEQRRIGRVVRQFLRNQLLGIELPSRATFYFMFRGDAPLRLTVYAPTPQQFTIRPEKDRGEFRQLLDDWWEATTQRYERVHRDAEYPIVVENYLTANWARRLGRDMPDAGMNLFGSRRIGGAWVSQLLANEAYQAAIERDQVLGRFDGSEEASMPLPSPPQWPQLVAPAPVGNVEVEPLAGRVPPECFYCRFGNFPNYLWFRDFLRHWQGDLGNMLVNRSINRNASERLQEQLAIHETSIARTMGPKVIHDVSFVGFDYYLRDGAAFGILFQADNNMLLSRNFNGQRSDAQSKYPDSTLETVQIAGHDVSFLSTPDGKLHSYYATDGDFHLIATSRRLVERFYEVGADHKSLAALAEFKAARADMPLARNDTIFLYLSAAFFDHLSSPAYRVELDRRLRSIGEMRILELARMAAKAESSNAQSVNELVAAQLLPRGFDRRSDGSALVKGEDGYRDSVRGVPGWFLPVADVPVDRITPSEAQHYSAFVRSIQNQVGRFVPLAAGVQRQTSDDGKLDRVVADLRVAPYSQTRAVDWIRMLGPVDKLRVAPIAGDVASLELIVNALGQPVHVFGGLRDFHTPLVVRQGEVTPNATPAEFVRGYVGTWPRPHLLDRWLGPPAGPADADGVTPSGGLFSLFQRRVDDFFLFSFKRDVLMEVGPQLAMVDAERPAQIRLHIDDLSDKQVATGVNGLGYMRARNTSASASRFMNSLSTQLHVPAGDAHDVAEQLVGGKFECPLGGEYKLLEAGDPAMADAGDSEHLPTPGSRQLWASTATPRANRFLLTEIPADYTMSLMNWFRGLSLEVARIDPGGTGDAPTVDALTAHAELLMVHQDVGPPAGDSGGGFFGNLFGGWGSSKEEKQNDPKPKTNGEALPAPAPQ